MQELIVGLLVAWSVWRVLRRFAAQPLYRGQLRLANLVKQVGWLGLAAWLTPVAPTAAGCGSGCDGCASGSAANAVPNAASRCASHPAAEVDADHEQAAPVQWR